MSAPLLDVRGLKTWFETPKGTIKAVDGVDLTLHRGQILGLVGETNMLECDLLGVDAAFGQINRGRRAATQLANDAVLPDPARDLAHVFSRRNGVNEQ